MATFTKTLLSGSTNGKPIKVAATSIGSGTTIHTAGSGTGFIDLVTLMACNTDAVSRVLKIGWGGTTDPDEVSTVTLPPKSGWVPVGIKVPIQNALVVKASADAANVVIVEGTVDHIA